MRRLALGSCVLVFAALGAVRADDPAPTIDDVKTAWKERQDAHESFRIEWVETVTEKAGSRDGFIPPGQPPGPHPPKDVEYTTTKSFAADGEKVAGTEEGQIYFITGKRWQPYMHTGRFNGRTAMELNPLQRPGWGLVTLRSGKDRLDASLSSFANKPVLRFCRPLGAAAFEILDFKKVKLSGRTEKIRGAECAEVVIEGVVPHSSYSVWCDPDRGYLPLRERDRYRDGDGFDFEWEYRLDDRKRWVPAGWEMKQTASDGSVVRATRAEVKKLDLAPKLAAGAFAPTPPPSSWVMVYEDGVQKEEYLVRADGSKRPLKGSERTANFDELSKTNADGTPYVPAKK
jgi:hypothetical protein